MPLINILHAALGHVGDEPLRNHEANARARFLALGLFSNRRPHGWFPFGLVPCLRLTWKLPKGLRKRNQVFQKFPGSFHGGRVTTGQRRSKRLTDVGKQKHGGDVGLKAWHLFEASFGRQRRLQANKPQSQRISGVHGSINP